MTTLLTPADLPVTDPGTVPARPAPHRRPDPELCAHPLWGEPTGLPCMRPAGHTGGHVYHDPTGSAVDDRHADGGHG